MKDKRKLWEALKAYRFEDLVQTKVRHRISALFGEEDASTLAFASKLARKYKWSSSFALRAILEYKKFVFLGVTGKNAVTPPKVIDAVWHQHLQFTAGYRHFCKSVLGTNFDHDPELIPFDEQTENFDAQYHETLERYQAEFHMDPPEDIWGTPKFKQKDRKGDAPLSTSSGGDDMMLWQYYTPGKGSDPSCITSDFHDMTCKPVGMSHASVIDTSGVGASDAGSSDAGGGGGGCSGGGGGGCGGGGGD